MSASRPGDDQLDRQAHLPGSELASVAEVLASLSRVSRLSLFHAQQIGTHYARMWDLYLGYCEAAFQDRHIGNVQLLLTKSAITQALPGEPWHRAPQSRARTSSATSDTLTR